MVAYYFRMTECPRTLTRDEWRDIYRRVRVGRKWAREQTERSMDMIREFNENIPEHTMKDMIDMFVTPPIVLGPFMDRGFHEDMVIK